MPKRKKKRSKRVCPWRVNPVIFKEAHALALDLYAHGDDYLQAVCEVVGYAKDGRSRKRVKMVERAVKYQYTVRALFALLDPEHYRADLED